MSTAIRLVRCPKCRRVLPELPNVPLYKCGGCGAILQAKEHRNDVKGKGSRAQETDPIKKHEPNTSVSSLEGDQPSIVSLPGSDGRGEKIDCGSYISGRPVDTNLLEERSHSTEPDYVQDEKSSPETNESAVRGQLGRLLEDDDGLRKNESLNHSSAKPRDRTSYELSSSCDSFNENEDSSSEGSISGKQYEKRCSPNLNVVTPVKEIEDSNSVLAEEETSSGEPKSLDQHETHFSAGKSLVDVAKEGQNIGKYTDEIEGSQGELAKEERCSAEPESLDDPETTKNNPHDAETSLLTAAEYSVADENSQSHLENPLGPEEDEKITNAQGSLTRSIEFAPLTPNDKFLKESHELGPSFHRISSEEMSDTSPRIPFAPLSPDDEYLKEPREVGPSFHRMSSEEERLDSSPSSPRFPISPLSPDHEYLKEPREVDPGPSFHRISSEEEKLDTLPIHPRFPIAPPSPDHIYVNEPHEIGPSFHRISSEEEKLDTINPRFPIAPLSPDDTFLEKSHEVGPNFHRISSEGMFDTSPINPRVPIGLMSKSPTKVYYAGDESESVYDGTEELSAKVSYLYRRNLKEVGTTGTNRSRQKDGFRVKNKQNGELQLHNEQLDFFSKFKEPRNFSGAERDWTSHESPESIKRNRPVRTSMIAANNEPVSRGSYMPRSSQLFHGNGSPARSTHNGDFHQPDTLLGSDPEKNELLRMVYDLEDKINRSHMSGERSPFRSVGEEMRTVGHYDNPATGRNPHGDINYSGHQRNHPQGVGRVNRPRSSKLAFSGEASLCRNHIDCRCSHCYHQDLHFSKKLSSHCIHCQHAANPRHDYDNIYRSYSPSPQHYTSSEFSHEIQADNLKQDHEMKMLRLKEKHQLKKRHLRPVSGAAPIISCYHCSELLQLPADFLLFKKRCHHLRCNSCNKILKFSFLKELNLVPYAIKIQAPPPGEMDGSSNIVDSRTVASTSHANNSQDAGPVSFSEDFEPSLSRNGSTESGPSVPSSLSVPKNLSNGNSSSNHTLQSSNDRKMKTVMDIYQDNKKSASYNIEAAGPSSSTSTWVKPSSEIEELPATSCPPLHRLMGYESPRQVIFARSDDDSDDGMGYYMDQQIR